MFTISNELTDKPSVHSTLTLRDALLCYDGAILTCQIGNTIISTFFLQFRSEYVKMAHVDIYRRRMHEGTRGGGGQGEQGLCLCGR